MQDARFLDRQSPPGLVTLTLLAGLSALTLNIFLPSLPAMAAWFGAPYATMQLSVALYLTLSGALQLVIGPLSDRYGRRPVVLWSLGLFLVATVGTLLAPNVTVFLAFRMAQAAVVSGIVLSRAIVRDMVEGARAASMIGYVTMGMTLVPMIGPALGGLLGEWFGWQASFVLLLLTGLGVFALAWADLGETGQPGARGLAAQIAMYPALFGSGTFWAYCLTAAFASGCFYAYLGGAPWVGTELYGLTPSQVGLLFGLTAIGYAAGNFLAGKLSVRLGMDRMILLGTGVTTAGLGLLAGLTAAGLSGAVPFFALTLFMGMGNGICLPNANAGLLQARPDLAGTASGLGGAIMIGGGAGLAALAGHLLGPGTGEMPLVLLMLFCSVASNLGILALMIARRA